MDSKRKGYSLSDFGWSMSSLSKVFHSKHASTVEKFVEIWKSDVRPHNCLSTINTTPVTTPSENAPLSTRDTTTPSRKRSATDAQLSQPSPIPPALRPVHIVHNTSHNDSDNDSSQTDEAIEKAFLGKCFICLLAGGYTCS